VSTSACPASGNSPDAPTDRTQPPNRPDPPSAENKRGFGFHPLLAFVDHGTHGTGEPLTVMLRTGRAGANTAADHIKVTADALAQPPSPASGRFGREVLIRTDGAGGTHKFVQWLTDQQVAYSVGFGLCESTAAAVDDLPDAAWIPAIDATGTPRKPGSPN